MRGDLESKITHEGAIVRTLEFLHERRRPVFIGEVAIAIGFLWTLEDAETLLEQLAQDGRVKIVPGSLIRYEEGKVEVKALLD